MNKVKIFFAASALLLATAGVFAGNATKAKHILTHSYYFNPNVTPAAYYEINTSLTTGVAQVTIDGYGVYADDLGSQVAGF